MYGNGPTIPMCTSVTQWQADERACETFHVHFENVLGVFATSYALWKESQALGLFFQASSCQAIAANLMLLNVFKSIKLLILFSRISKEACSVGNPNTYSELCVQSLNKLKEKSNYCNSENFNCLKQTADDKTLTIPPSAWVRSQEFDLQHFIYDVFTKFIDVFLKEMMHFHNVNSSLFLTFWILGNFWRM